MSLRFNNVFAICMMSALAGALLIPPAVTDRAKGKADVLLYPVVKPVRGVAASLQRRFGHKSLPPGETQPRTDADLAAENGELRQQLTYLIKQLEDLRLVEDEYKRLGPLLKYFKPVAVIGGDATPGRDSLGLMPATGVDTAAGAPVMYSDGLAGRMAAGGRVRLITDRGFKITAEFGRIGEHAQWIPIPNLKASVTGIGDNTMRVDHLFLKDTEGLKPGDMVVISDPELAPIVQNRPLGQIESIRPQTAKPLFAEIIIKPRTDLRKLNKVLVLRK